MSNRPSPAQAAGGLIPTTTSARALWLATAAICVALASLPWLVKLDGHPHADWQQFLGRFHPLTVHLPIGLLVLVPVLEVAGIFRPALREAASFVLALACASCFLALTLGLLLAYGSGDSGILVSRHMIGAIALTIAVLLCLLVRPSWSTGQVGFLYPVMLVAVLGILTWTAHLGGSITHGSNYLTQYLPAFLKSKTIATAPTKPIFESKINPILDANCVSCHGPSKTSGGLRLDSYEALMKGGDDGPVIVPNKSADSELFKRITLPHNHPAFMPSEGRPPLHPDDIAWIKSWIEQGASPIATSLTGMTLKIEPPAAPAQPVGDYSALMPQIKLLAQAQGAKLIPMSSHPEDGLVLYTADTAAKFDDAQLAQFEKFAPYIVEAELGRTAITNASFDTLQKFTHLRALHLEETHITGEGLAKLAPLSQLTYLNLSGTQVTSATTAPLSAMKNLRHIYLYNTPAQPAPDVDLTEPVAQSSAQSPARNNP